MQTNKNFFTALLVTMALLTTFLLTPPVSAQDDVMKRINPRMRDPMPINLERVEAAGIRVLEGKHVTIYTDVQDDPLIDELPLVFDTAVGHWCAYFELRPRKTEGWRVSGFVMKDKERFRMAGLLPEDVPEFPAGFNRGHEWWVIVSPGEYYTRHLVLHEGTHAFMQWFLGGSGAPWYSEGMAEMLALHRWTGSELELNFRPRRSGDVPYWGRPRIIREGRAAGNVPTLDDIFTTPAIGFRDVEKYAWSWAAARFLSNHPLSREAFKSTRDDCDLSFAQFGSRLERAISGFRAELNRDWQLYLAEQDYGYEIERGALIEVPPLEPGAGETGSDNSVFEIRSDRAWQITGIEVEEGDQFLIDCSGRYQIGRTTEPWICEPGGVTIEYYRGRPLGMLLAGVLGDDGSVTDLISGHEIGLQAELTAGLKGRLCFRVNDSPARMDDNDGTVNVSIRKK